MTADRTGADGIGAEGSLAEEMPRATEACLLRVFLISRSAMALTEFESGRIVDVNPRWSQETGVSREEAIGETAIRLGFWADKADREACVAELARTGRLHDVEVRLMIRSKAVPHIITAELIELDGRRYAFWEFRDIGIHKEMEEHLRASESELRRMLEQSDRSRLALLSMAEDQRAVEESLRRSEAILNETGAIARIGGWEHDLLAGRASWTKALYDITEWEVGPPPGPDEYLDYCPPPDGAILAAAYQRSVETGEPFDLDLQVYTAKKRTIWARIIGRPVMEGGKCVRMVGTFQDITERRRAERALRDSENRFRRAIENIPDVVAIHDRDLRVRFVNQAARRITGQAPSEVLGEREEEAWPPEVYRVYLAKLAEARDSLAVRSLETELAVPGGGKRSLVITCVPLVDEDGEVRETLAITHDLTDRKQAEEDLKTANARLEQAAAQAKELAVRAEAANRAKSEFLANMSHEIRTPMTAILGFSELLASSELPPREQRQFLASIQRNGEALMSLLSDILDLSRIEAGKMPVERIDYSLRQVMEDVLTIVRLRAQEKGLRLEVDYATGVAETIHTDPVRLRQILVNLVGNAVKFTDRGEVRVGVRSVGDAGSPARVEFAVCDTGIGITAERLAGLFQPFTQGDTSSTRLYGGVGLGLAISKRLAAMLNGDIKVASELGNGSTFTLSIDAGPPPQAASDVAPVERGPSPHASGRLFRGRVLLAEDMPDVQRAVAQILRAARIEVDVADNGRTACQMAEKSRAEGRPYEVILMDIRMPEMDGYEATQWLRRHGWAGAIVALTAYAMGGDREKCLAAGCNDYLPKPFTTQQLDEMLTKYLAVQGPPS